MDTGKPNGKLIDTNLGPCDIDTNVFVASLCFALAVSSVLRNLDGMLATSFPFVLLPPSPYAAAPTPDSGDQFMWGDKACPRSVQ